MERKKLLGWDAGDFPRWQGREGGVDSRPPFLGVCLDVGYCKHTGSPMFQFRKREARHAAISQRPFSSKKPCKVLMESALHFRSRPDFSGRPAAETSVQHLRAPTPSLGVSGNAWPSLRRGPGMNRPDSSRAFGLSHGSQLLSFGVRATRHGVALWTRFFSARVSRVATLGFISSCFQHGAQAPQRGGGSKPWASEAPPWVHEPSSIEPCKGDGPVGA